MEGLIMSLQTYIVFFRLDSEAKRNIFTGWTIWLSQIPAFSILIKLISHLFYLPTVLCKRMCAGLSLGRKSSDDPNTEDQIRRGDGGDGVALQADGVLL